jgi:hypothetical protein
MTVAGRDQLRETGSCGRFCNGGMSQAHVMKKERAMKLTSVQVERTLGQIEARAIPDDHPVVQQLNDLFGEHTFFLDSNGLNIVEPAESAEAGIVQSAKIVNLASWNADDDLEPHEPKPTDVVIMLGVRH